MVQRSGSRSLDPPKGELSPAAFERWLRPAEAIQRLTPILHEREAQREIHRRVCEGEVLTVARTATWYGSGPAGLEVRDYTRLGAFLWQFNAAPKDYDLLWKTGTHTLEWITSQHSSKRHKVECFGIRFDPAGIGAILTDAGVDCVERSDASGDEPKSKRDLPPLPEKHLRAWHTLFREVYPTGSVTLASQSVSGAFPNHHVSRQRVRELFPEAQRGRPKKNKDLGNSPESDGE